MKNSRRFKIDFANLFMIAAIEDAKKGIIKGNSPFGACIVKNNKIIALAHNTVLVKSDATCHAEINAIVAASKNLGTWDLSGCTIYSTTEPCPMCFSAIHWARIEKIIYGTMIPDVQSLGFSELTINNTTMKRLGGSKIKLDSGFMRKECLDLLKYWKKNKNKKTY